MKTITTSEKTGSYASTIASQFNKRKLPLATIVPNRKIYHKKFPHVVEITDHRSGDYKSYMDIRSDMHHVSTRLHEKLNNGVDDPVVKTRVEGYTLRIYTTDVLAVLNNLKPGVRKRVTKIELMESHVENHIKNTPKETFRTVDKVVRKLPYGNQKYRVYYAHRGSVKASIGKDSLEGILFQLLQYDSIRWTDYTKSAILDMQGSWSETFFYCTDLDWLPIITLIDGRFIKRIERFTVENEIAV